MKAVDCKIGMVVFHCDDGPTYCMEVTSEPDEQGTVSVKALGKNAWQGPTANVKYLVEYNEEKIKASAAELQTKINAAKDAFEIAFDNLREIRNFNEDGINRYSLEDMKLITTSELEKTFEEGGWSSSSLWC